MSAERKSVAPSARAPRSLRLAPLADWLPVLAHGPGRVCRHVSLRGREAVHMLQSCRLLCHSPDIVEWRAHHIIRAWKRRSIRCSIRSARFRSLRQWLRSPRPIYTSTSSGRHASTAYVGAAPTYEEHPIHKFVERGIPVALCADIPVQIATTIGREYALAHTPGFSLAEPVGFTTNAIHASFTPPACKAALLAELAEGDGRGGGRRGR